jgi:voltage-gated potassium channel
MSTGSGTGTQDDISRRTQGDSRAERTARWMRTPLIVAALLAIPTIIVQEADLGRAWEILGAGMDWCIWAVFAANLIIMLAVVPNKRRWLIQNPLDLLIVVLTPPFLPVTFKLARVLPIVRLFWILAVAHRLRNVFSLQGLRYAALLLFTIVVGGGVLFVAVEPDQHLSTWDGLWWAIQTVTTVTYGGPYPTTALARIVATVVMTSGIGFVALLTGALAQRFLYGASEGAASEAGTNEAEITKRLDELSNQIARLRQALEERQG